MRQRCMTCNFEMQTRELSKIIIRYDYYKVINNYQFARLTNFCVKQRVIVTDIYRATY